MSTQPLDRDYPKLTLDQIKFNLGKLAVERGPDNHNLATIAYATWPGRRFRSAQGAAMAAGGLTEKLGLRRSGKQARWAIPTACVSDYLDKTGIQPK